MHEHVQAETAAEANNWVRVLSSINARQKAPSSDYSKSSMSVTKYITQICERNDIVKTNVASVVAMGALVGFVYLRALFRFVRR
jgi:hypothetical protein